MRQPKQLFLVFTQKQQRKAPIDTHEQRKDHDRHKQPLSELRSKETHAFEDASPRGRAVGGGPRLLPAVSSSLKSKAESLSLSVDASGVVPSSEDSSTLCRNRMRRCFSAEGGASPATTGPPMTTTVQRALMVVLRSARLTEWSVGNNFQALSLARACQTKMKSAGVFKKTGRLCEAEKSAGRWRTLSRASRE